MSYCTIVNIDRCSLNDGPGIRTVIFFKGCNLRCMWCHNPETYSFEPQEYLDNGKKKVYGYRIDTEEINKLIMKDLGYYKSTNGGVTLSGGEALLQIDAATEIAKFCKENNINVCVETSGAVPLNNIKKIEKYVDCWLYDYKLSDQSKYLKYLKASSSLILSNLKYLIDSMQNIILRCPIIHTLNDNDEHFKKIACISHNVNSVEILPYHNLGKSKAQKLHVDKYFWQENTSKELKELWKMKLNEFNCKNFKLL